MKDFIEVDLTKITSRGVPLSAIPHYAATDGHPEGGPPTDGERIVVTVDDWEEADKVFYTHVILPQGATVTVLFGDGHSEEWDDLGEAFALADPDVFPGGAASGMYRAIRIDTSKGPVGFKE